MFTLVIVLIVCIVRVFDYGVVVLRWSVVCLRILMVWLSIWLMLFWRFGLILWFICVGGGWWCCLVQFGGSCLGCVIVASGVSCGLFGFVLDLSSFGW